MQVSGPFYGGRLRGNGGAPRNLCLKRRLHRGGSRREGIENGRIAIRRNARRAGADPAAGTQGRVDSYAPAALTSVSRLSIAWNSGLFSIGSYSGM